jgi:hypothetical protein
MSWDSGPSYDSEDERDNAAWDRLAELVIRNDPLDVTSARAMLAAHRTARRTRNAAFITGCALIAAMLALNLPMLFLPTLPTLALFGVAAWLTQRHDLRRARGRRLVARVIEAERCNAPDARMGEQ